MSKKLLGLALLAACTFTAQAADLKPLKVAIDPTYEPFTFKTADGKPTGFDVDIAEGCDCQGNPDQLREALANLLENALVHGFGTVRVTLRSVGLERQLEVSDQGLGIAQQDREAMFMRFRKGQQNTEGTGLGLAIVRQIVQNAGGNVAFVEAPHTTVRMTLAAV